MLRRLLITGHGERREKPGEAVVRDRLAFAIAPVPLREVFAVSI